MTRSFDQRTLAVLASEAGALPLLLIGFIWPNNVVENGRVWLAVIGLYTAASITFTVLMRPLDDTLFTILSFGGMLGIVGSSAVIVDEGAAHSVLVLLAVIPALAAMESPTRTVVTFVVAAAGLASVVVVTRASGIVPLVVGEGAVVMAIIVPTYLVMTLRRSLEKSLARQAILSETDPLTGVLNRRGLAKRWGELLATSAAPFRRVGFIEADVDYFKEINDEHGHSVGDAILVDIAATLRATVDPSALVARTGGEEFVVVVNARDEATLAQLCEKLRVAVADNVAATVSIGAVCATIARGCQEATGNTRSTLDELLAVVDGQLYEAKRLGRNRITVTSTRIVATPKTAEDPAEGVMKEDI